MKIATTILMILAVILIGFNATKIDFDAPFEGDSMIAIISIVAGLCALLILIIFQLSKKIQQRIKTLKNGG